MSFFLRYLADQIAQGRHHDCSSTMYPDQLAPRVDAQASAERTGTGGWFPHVDQSGNVNVAASRWFSHEITRDEWPWVFEKSSKPALAISTLGALGAGRSESVLRRRTQNRPQFYQNRAEDDRQ